MELYKLKKEINISAEEMNRRLAYVKEFRNYRVVSSQSQLFNNEKIIYSSTNALIENKLTKVILTYKDDEDFRVVSYICRKDGEINGNYSGAVAFAQCCKMYKQSTGKTFPKYRKLPFDVERVKNSPFNYFDPQRQNQYLYAYGYDMNSAYGYAMIQDIPDTTKGFHCGEVKPNEIGFDLDLKLMRVGEYADFIFPKTESVFKSFVNKYYGMKQNAKNKEERKLAKAMLNNCAGIMVYKNIFLRAFIVEKSNQFIEDLIDENTIYCNTDSIVSVKSRADLKLGNGLGEFKIEHEGKFSYIGNVYQWYGNDGKISYKGVPESYRSKEGYDILIDKPEEKPFKYRFDVEELKLIENDR